MGIVHKSYQLASTPALRTQLLTTAGGTKLLAQAGVTPTLWYDAAGRNVRTDLPDGTFVKTAFDAWQSTQYDGGDTVKESAWYTHALASGDAEQQRAAQFSAGYHNTPIQVHLDPLGRTIYAQETDGTTTSAVFTQTDLSGRYRQLYDPLATEELLANAAGNYSTSRGGEQRKLDGWQALHSWTAVKGHQYTWTDVGERLLVTWDNPDAPTSKTVTATYDALHRPLKSYVAVGSGTGICLAKTVYGDDASLTGLPSGHNLRGQVYQSFDQAGVRTTEEVDFKGNPLRMSQQLATNYTTTIHWDATPAPTLETDTFTTQSSYDALNRPTLTTLPDGSQLRPTYGKGAYTERLEARVQGTWYTVMEGQTFDAKGQRQQVNYGNKTLTQYFYHPKSFRLERLLSLHQNQDQLQDLYYTYDAVGNVTTIKGKAPIIQKKENTYFITNKTNAITCYYNSVKLHFDDGKTCSFC